MTKSTFIIFIMCFCIVTISKAQIDSVFQNPEAKYKPILKLDSLTTSENNKNLTHEVSAIYEFITYWDLGLEINSHTNLDFEGLPLEFFSRKYAPKSGGALSIRYLFHSDYGKLGFHLGLELSKSKTHIYLHTPELGISWPEMESELGYTYFWLGFIYAPYFLNHYWIRPHINIDGGAYHSWISLKLNGTEINSNSNGLTTNKILLRYGLGVDIAISEHLGFVLKYQRYMLSHSRFEPEKGLIIEGNHNDPFLFSLGFFYKD